MPGSNEHLAVVEEVYNQAVNSDALVGQESNMAELAAEAGTTVEALAVAREQREAEAAQRLKIDLDAGAIAVSNEADHWMNNEER